jgi:phosphate transport system substrate-binding protein
MQGQGFPFARLRAAVVVVGIIAAIAVMAWYWRNGGAQVFASRSNETEECGVVLSGSSTVGLELAPALISDFLARGGYEVEPIAHEDRNLVRITGRRGDYRCSVRVRTSESTNGFRDLADGAALIAMSSRPITPAEIERMRESRAGDFASERALAEHAIAHDAVAIIVHADNPAAEVTIDQVRGIAIGAARNWIDYGGRNAPILIHAPLELAGADDYPNDLVRSTARFWGDAPSRSYVRLAADDTATIEAVAREPNGLGFVSAAFRRDGQRVRDLRINAGGVATAPTRSALSSRAYPIVRRVFFYVRPNDMRENPFAHAFLAYAASAEAFARIEEMGFIALRPEAVAEADFVRQIGCRIGVPEAATLASMLRGATRSETILRFSANTTQFDAPAAAAIERIAPDLAAEIAAGGQVTLVGHSDIQGTVADNRALALERAIAARTAFEARGVFGMHVESAGEVCPVADTESAAGRRLNRRVEIWVRSAEQGSSGSAR